METHEKIDIATDIADLESQSSSVVDIVILEEIEMFMKL